MSKFVIGYVIGLICLIAATEAQELTPPKDWNIEKQAGQLLLRPTTLSSGQNVQVQIHDAAPLPPDLIAWLAEQMKANGAGASDLATCRAKMRHETEASCVTKSGGADQYWYAFKTPDNQARFVHAVMGPNTLATMRYIAPMERLLKLAEANIGRAGADEAKTEKIPAPVPTANPPVASPPVSGSSYTAPIEGIYLHLEYLSGVGGGVYPSYEPYILLTGGIITGDLGYYPSSSADIANWMRRKPRAWGRYTRNGTSLSIRWNDARRKPETWDKWFVAKPGPEAMKLSGLFQSIGGGGNTSLGGSTIVAAWSNFRFASDGTVLSDGGSGAGAPNVSVSSQQASKRASYHISGHSIDLQYGNGRQERAWFFLFPDSDNTIGVGNKVLVKRK